MVRTESRIPFIIDLEQCQYYALNRTSVSFLNDLNISKEIFDFREILPLHYGDMYTCENTWFDTGTEKVMVHVTPAC